MAKENLYIVRIKKIKPCTKLIAMYVLDVVSFVLYKILVIESYSTRIELIRKSIAKTANAFISFFFVKLDRKSSNIVTKDKMSKRLSVRK